MHALEDSLGYPLPHRRGKQATPTEQRERRVSYARQILALEQEALDVVARPGSEGVLRLSSSHFDGVFQVQAPVRYWPLAPEPGIRRETYRTIDETSERTCSDRHSPKDTRFQQRIRVGRQGDAVPTPGGCPPQVR
jgi:DNA-binding transcriptional LysR family regulator